MLTIGDSIEVTIEKMANRGKGLARFNDQVIFVPYSAPGDHLLVRVLKVNKNFVDAEVSKIISPSNLRVEAPCPYFTHCGGCHFQHLRYDAQVEIKDLLVKETLQRALPGSNFEVLLPPIASPKEFNYRNRIQIHIENGNIGFRKRNTHTIIPIESCLIAEEPINNSLREFKQKMGSPTVDKLEILLDKSLTVHQRDLNSKGQPALFSQVNRFTNGLLVKSVVDRVQNANPKGKIHDLYSGDGNFLLEIASVRPQNECIGVELNPGLVRQGRQDIRSKSLRAAYVQSSVENYMETVSIDASDLIVLDPPRIGCDPKAMMILGSARRSRVIYVSCEPTTLARDLRLLKETAAKWGLAVRLFSVQTFDLFPQTEHVETVVEFSIDKIDTLAATH